MNFRYYKGKIKIKLISKISPLKTIMVESLEFGKIGQKNVGYKITYPGEKNICRIRDCWRKILDEF